MWENNVEIEYLISQYTIEIRNSILTKKNCNFILTYITLSNVFKQCALTFVLGKNIRKVSVIGLLLSVLYIHVLFICDEVVKNIYSQLYY